MVKTVIFSALGLLLLAAVFILLLAARQPDTFRVQRTATIAAPPERVFAMINDLQQMNRWNPFVKKDPAIKGRYQGPASGPGAGYEFSGNSEVGTGSLRIVDAAAPSRVAMKLLMSAPMQADNDIVFSLAPEGPATRVTWSMEGPCPFIGKLMGVVFNMDRMVGGAFEQGLADLKAQAEKA
jgi:uncharacterized protein YndB with AHSA1/START domain